MKKKMAIVQRWKTLVDRTHHCVALDTTSAEMPNEESKKELRDDRPTYWGAHTYTITHKRKRIITHPH